MEFNIDFDPEDGVKKEPHSIVYLWNFSRK
jgi:hypothetical protein